MQSIIAERLRKLRLCEDSSRREDSSKYSFRFTNIFPSRCELLDHNQTVLPQNITKGPYNSLCHYLNTHFVLLREDFIKPIRESLVSFLNNPSKKPANIEVHQVHFIRKGVNNNDVCYGLEIIKGITYDSLIIRRDPKRFMNGSLLIFSHDNFKTIICGKVADNERIIHKMLLVSFEKSVNLKYKTNYLMIECNTFFEPYYHVLKVIQNIHSSSFSMEQYLVEAHANVAAPEYLNGIKYRISDPKLNKSQLAAINGALSQELAVIQGPPGTGKTFLGLKLAKQLLSLSSKWHNKSPMLVISVTNHALDQFLEGLTDSTEDILRIGGQSKSAKMEKYSLKNRRLEFYDSLAGTTCKRKMAPTFKKIKGIENEMTSINNQLDNIATINPTCIFNFDVLAKSVPEINKWFPRTRHDLMIVWLLEQDDSIAKFKQHFRIDPNSASILLNQYETSRFYKTPNTWSMGSQITDAKVELYLFLWFAGNKTCLREVSLKFRVALSTSHKAVEKVMDFLVDLAPQYIKFPSSAQEKEKMSEDFQKVAGFPSILGCIDGTSIPIVTPACKIKSTYVNRHDIPCITLQGICDHRKLFLDVFTGVPGKVHDARVFKLSYISKDLRKLCENGNYHIIGDSAYYIREWLLTPYGDYGNLSEAEKLFIKRFRQTRVLIENAFGLLKGRFRQLLIVYMHSVDKISKFVISCCVLHNMCILHNDILEEIPTNDDEDPIGVPDFHDRETDLRKLGEQKRNLLTQRLSLLT